MVEATTPTDTNMRGMHRKKPSYAMTSTDMSAYQGAANAAMGQSKKDGARQKGYNDKTDSGQGEIKIKYTDCSKEMFSKENLRQLVITPERNKTEVIEIDVYFAMAYGDT